MKLIASDYDGTFRTNEIQLQRNIAAAKRWQQAGHLFGIVTGRSIEMIQAALKLYRIPVDFLVCNNGASVYSGMGRLLSTAHIESKDLGALLELEEMGKSFHHIFITEQGSFAKRLSPLSWIEDKEFKLTLIDSYERIRENDLIQISTCFKTTEEAASCTERVNQLFGREIYANLNQDCVDITPAGIDKCVGVNRLLEQLSGSFEKVLTIGDGENDIPMIKHFHGATVVGASEVVKNASGKIYESFEEMVKEFI